MESKLKLIIDTGTWLKLDKLLKERIITQEFINGLYSLAEIYITPEIETELIHFSPQSWIKRRTYILPITNSEGYVRALNDGFDAADASIFGIDAINDYYIISEDRPLITYGKMYKRNLIFLIEFLKKLQVYGIISKKELYQLNLKLYNLRNINKILFKKTKESIRL